MDENVQKIPNTSKPHLQWLAILIPIVGAVWIYLCLRVRGARRGATIKGYDVERRYVTPSQQQQFYVPPPSPMRSLPLLRFSEPLPGGPHIHSWNNSSAALQRYYQHQRQQLTAHQARQARRGRRKKQRKIRTPPPAYLGATASPPPPRYEDIMRKNHATSSSSSS